MTNQLPLQKALDGVLQHYRDSFSSKVYEEENNEIDPLMDVFGITPELKRENRQYWGRELGMCWQRLIVEVCRQTRPDFAPPLKFNADEPCDLLVGNQAIDTKYRIGSGDSGTLKKFKTYASLLRNAGYEPILLIVRDDNLPAAINACQIGGWSVLTGNATFSFIHQLTGFDIRAYLMATTSGYKIDRS
ncbi:MAG: restriction endonuclease [Acidobacteria bacterium]|nr:restriction endonuclease [Acidobacteriota bacterium]